METVVAIAADDRVYGEMVIPFFASLRDNARFNGKVCVIDYGLSERRKRKLVDAGCFIMQPLKKHFLCLDKVATVAELGEDVCYCLYDADIWFASPIDELLALPSDRVFATFDAWVCTFLYDCLPPKNRPAFQRVMERHLAKHEWAMQSGMVKSARQGFRELAAVQTELLTSGFANDAYGADTSALHVFFDRRPELAASCDISFNCVPKWEGFRRLSPTEWRVYDKPVATIHYTGDYRARKDQEHLSYRYNFPERFSHWSGILD